MKWIEQAWQAALPAFNKILELDFIPELTHLSLIPT